MAAYILRRLWQMIPTLAGVILFVFFLFKFFGGDPAEIVESRGMKQVTDTGAIERAVDEIIAANPDQVAKVLAKPTLAGWFVGQVMKSTGGKANPQAVQALVKAKLGIVEE